MPRKQRKQRKKRYTKEQKLKHYIAQQKRDLIATMGKLEYFKRYEPDVYRKIMDKGA